MKREFEAGNFVVKLSLHRFSQVDPDHSQEWLGCIGKKGGDIVGITKTSSALSRWALSFNLRSHLAQDTKVAYGQGPDDDYICNEMATSRMKRNYADEDALLAVLQRFGLFSAILSKKLQNIANKDEVTLEIEKQLLTIPQNGQSQLDSFVEERLLPSERRRDTFRDKLKNNKYLTFASLFDVKRSDPKTGKAKTIKADRNILQRLISVYDAGRPVNLNRIMAHELFVVPLSLAEVNGQLRSGSKAILATIITAGVECPDHLHDKDLDKEPMLIIDGQALVIAIAKPEGAKTFGDLAGVFVEAVLKSGAKFQRIDVLFNRCQTHSFKSGTRNCRGRGLVTIQRPFESTDLPLPAKWENFIAHQDNKADLA